MMKNEMWKLNHEIKSMGISVPQHLHESELIYRTSGKMTII
jgi:hypothetical protein